MILQLHSGQRESKVKLHFERRETKVVILQLNFGRKETKIKILQNYILDEGRLR